MPKQRLVVIGNGMAGACVVERVLALGGGAQFAISVFAGEPYGPYDRMQLADVMSGAQPAEQLFHKDLRWYDENGVTIHLGEHAKVVSRSSRRVYGAKGTVEGYDALVLAMGSEAYVPPIKNILGNVSGLRDKVCAFRSLDDSRAIVSHAQHAKAVAILGGGVLALEAARGLLTHGCALHLVHGGAGLLYNQLGEAGSQVLRQIVEDAGVAVHLGAAVAAVVDETMVRGLALADGSSLECDLVVLALGIQPTTWIAMQCGLTVSRAIVVDNQMRSIDDPQIFAVGECAEHRGRVESLPETIREQASVIAAHLTAGDSRIAGARRPLVTRLRLLGKEAAWMGALEAEAPYDDVRERVDARGDFQRLVVRDGRLRGAVLLGDPSQVTTVASAFLNQLPVP